MVDHKVNHYTYTKKGFYYYSRRVPKDILGEYRKPRVVIALKTRCKATALKLATRISFQLESHWTELRFSLEDIPASKLLCSHNVNSPTVPYMSEALDLYLRIKGQGKNDLFFVTSQRVIKQVVSYSGDLLIDRYTRKDANGLRDKLLNDGLTPQSIKRKFNVIRAVLNLAIRENGLNCSNVFSNVEYGKVTPVKRKPIPDNDISHVQNLCKVMDNPNRWLVALISDTGLRLSEALGLLKSDFKLDVDMPYVDIAEHPWRSLKTASSVRKVPLIGMALWAAQRILADGAHEFAFPKYTNKDKCNANSASASVNKWLRNHVPENCVVHSFRHSFRDRLRAVQCPTDIVDQLGGWSSDSGVGQSYGEGYQLKVLSEWIRKIPIKV